MDAKSINKYVTRKVAVQLQFTPTSKLDRLIKVAFYRGRKIKVAVDVGMERKLRVIGWRTFGLEIRAPRAHLNDPNIAQFQVD